MSYHSADVMGYVYDGTVYCVDCVEESEVESDENWGVIFADEFFDNDMGEYCCECCHHNLACVNQISGDMWENCPGCMEG